MIIPSIDLENGQAVQKVQGKETVLVSEREPIDLAREFNRYGPVAVIDLDAALGQGSNLALVRQLCRVAEVHAGGGLRNEAGIDTMLRAGASQVIIGTAATPELLAKFPADRIIVAVDHHDGTVLDHGWTKATSETVLERGQRLAPYCGGFLCTAVKVEGTMQGLPLDVAQQLRTLTGRPVTVAGGTRNTEDCVRAARAGLDVQVGRSLYSGELNLNDTVVRSLDWSKYPDLLIPTIAQDDLTGQILIHAYSSRNSLRRALQQGTGTYFSRSRNEIWTKGLTSGHTQEIVAVRFDCDRDALLFRVRQTGPACHTGSHSCFGARQFSLDALQQTLRQRIEAGDPSSYTVRLAHDPDLNDAKIMEEAQEVCVAPDDDNLVWEVADVLYHMMVRLTARGIPWSAVLAELAGRERPPK